MSAATGLKVVGYFDCPGGGQVVVRDGVAYIGHVKPPNGTTLVDVSDPANPRKLSEITVPEGTLSHKVRVDNGIMLVNREIFPIGRKDPDFRGGLEIFDIAKPTAPRHIGSWPTRGMHRFTFDGRYVYGSPELDGYLGNVVSIIDFQKPDRPEEVGRWWMPGQWTAGGERPTWDGTDHRCHHPMRVGNRLYVSYWHGGFVILGIEDMTKPKFISGLDWSPPFPWPTHTALPVPFLDPSDVSNAVVYLASDDGRYVTGTAHIVDAGALNPFKAPHFRDAAGNLIGPREPRAVSSATASQR